MSASGGQLVAYSSERREGMRTQIGSANYSYVFVEDAVVGLLKANGYRTAYVTEPEIFKSRAAYEGLLQAPPEAVVHIAFRSTENIRPMSGARNICHFAWEFDVMKDTGLATDSILANQVHMLKLMDEVWVACRYTQDVLARYGILNTHVIPAPIVGDSLPDRIPFEVAVDELGAVAAVPLLYVGGLSRDENAALVSPAVAPLADLDLMRARAAGGEGRVFLSVLSPGDLRKNLLNIIDGFQLAVAGRAPGDIMIIKLAVSNTKDFRSQALYDSLSLLSRHQMAKRDFRIQFVVDYLTDRQMQCLFNLADFYVSASHCEGYNLPLLQAMAVGSVPVTVRNTAMLDYIDNENAILIDAQTMTSPIERMAADVAQRSYAIAFASRFDIARGITAALLRSDAEIGALAEAARATVMNAYSAPQVARSIRARLAPLEANLAGRS